MQGKHFYSRIQDAFLKVRLDTLSLIMQQSDRWWKTLTHDAIAKDVRLAGRFEELGAVYKTVAWSTFTKHLFHQYFCSVSVYPSMSSLIIIMVLYWSFKLEDYRTWNIEGDERWSIFKEKNEASCNINSEIKYICGCPSWAFLHPSHATEKTEEENVTFKIKDANPC